MAYAESKMENFIGRSRRMAQILYGFIMKYMAKKCESFA